jgi:hypothetical protein
MYDEKPSAKHLGNLFKKPNLVLPWLKMPPCRREYAGPKIFNMERSVKIA